VIESVARAPFQVLVLPYRITDEDEILYGLLKRDASTGGYWQPVAGGGEDDETPEQAARREAFEEAGIPVESELTKLESFSTLPVDAVCGFLWGDDVVVLPQHCFAVRLQSASLTLSEEHTEYRWLSYDAARELLSWDDNRTALWELNYRLTQPHQNST